MKTIYVDKEDVKSFLCKDNKQHLGYSYEWENEDVVHIRTEKESHAFGLASTALWTKTIETNEVQDVSYIVCVKSEDDVKVYDNTSEEWCVVSFIPAQTEMYSRSKGILEVDVLSQKRVMIVGLGSFGSQIAIELAKAGVGQFALFDFDRVELHNLARHTCGIKDLGRLKTDAIKDAILGKNKYAVVETFPVNIIENKDQMETQVAKSDVVICATDNNPSRFLLSKSLCEHNKFGLFGRAVTRAEGGDVFRYNPNGGPCYECLVESAIYSASAEEVTDRSQLPAYVSPEDADAIVQVGLSSDIEPICNLIVKLALIELAKGKQSGIEQLEKELTYDYYMWANRRERNYGNWAAFNNAANKPTILRWYGTYIAKNEDCPICSSLQILDEGSNIEEIIGRINKD